MSGLILVRRKAKATTAAVATAKAMGNLKKPLQPKRLTGSSSSEEWRYCFLENKYHLSDFCTPTSIRMSKMGPATRSVTDKANKV